MAFSERLKAKKEILTNCMISHTEESVSTDPQHPLVLSFGQFDLVELYRSLSGGIFSQNVFYFVSYISVGVTFSSISYIHLVSAGHVSEHVQ